MCSVESRSDERSRDVQSRVVAAVDRFMPNNSV